MEEEKKSKGCGIYIVYFFIIIVVLGLLLAFFFISKDLVTMMFIVKNAFYKLFP